MPTVISIPGLTSATKRPGFFGQIVNPGGRQSAGSIPLILLLVGNKTAAGAMTADGQPVLIASADDADFQAGPGSELACMAYGIGGTGAQGGIVGGALATDGVQIWLGCVAEATGSPAFATATITIAGSWTTGGTLTYRLSGITIQVSVGAADTATNVAANIALAINANARLPFTAAGSSGVCTITTKNKGLRNNWHELMQDKTLMPTGMTSTLAGGASITGGGVHFTAGAGSDSPANLLSVIFPTQYDRIAYSCGDNTLDTTNIALWKTQLNNQAAPTVGILEQLVIASNDTLVNAASIAQTTLNDIRFQMLWQLNGETHPSVVAATFAATRTLAETNDPDAYYDSIVTDTTLPGVAPQTQNADRPNNSTLETALGEGVTPVVTLPNGHAAISRSITTHCKNGSNADYRVLDTSYTTVPDFVLFDVELLWTTDFLPNNPRVQDNPASEVPTPQAGIAYPDLWSASVEAELKKLAGLDPRGTGTATGLPILDQNATVANPPISQFDPISKRIMSSIQVVPAANQHQIGVKVVNVTSG
jgi:phage tail sheath gpL-like